jgi:hypothetical protein
MWAGVPQGEVGDIRRSLTQEPDMYNAYVIESVARHQVDERVARATEARRERAARRTRPGTAGGPVPARQAFARVAALRIVLGA